MDIKASQRYIRISPRKVRLVADLIRGKSVEEAILILENTHKRASYYLDKLLKSAVANAVENEELGGDVSDLYIKRLCVEGGPVLKRFMPRAMGRATPIRKPTSHINVILDEVAK
ncbi:MAG: 50S ribosomal protein L22 [Planctomycetota bacterium]|jgi:large subunit ribosomal protein L22